MTIKSDIIVLGVGGMGSAACYHLAKRGLNVIGIEKFKLAHDLGSSHGDTRAIRKAYFEHPDYVPLLNRAYELWDELGVENGKPLLHRTGMVIYGPEAGGKILPGIEDSAQKFLLPIQKFSHGEAKLRFPHFTLPDGFRAVFEPEAGYLEVENSVKAHANIAKKCGAKLKFGEEVLEWHADENGVTVKTGKHVYQADKLVITAGAWASRVLSDIKVPVQAHRNVLLWYAYEKRLVPKSVMPCFCFDLPFGIFYGFPPLDKFGLKIANHAPGAPVENPDTVDRSLHDADTIDVRRCLSDVMPWSTHSVTKHAVCLYEMSPDGHFIVDKHPRHDNVVFAAGFSGHGYKFATVMGEILADLALSGETSHPIGFLKAGRFASVQS